MKTKTYKLYDVIAHRSYKIKDYEITAWDWADKEGKNIDLFLTKNIRKKTANNPYEANTIHITAAAFDRYNFEEVTYHVF